MSDELKPCPFCGQQPDVSMGGSIVSITCPRCNYEFDWARHGGFDWQGEWNARPIEDALQAEITALKEAARRIPVGERMPPRNVRVRVWINGTESIARYSWVVPQWETIDGLYYHGDTLDDVTHWQPLDEGGEG